MALLEVKDLTVRYGGVVALHRLSLQVEAGEIVTLLGANGAGKSTTLRAISGLVPPAGGQIRLDGEEVTRLPAHALVERGVAHVPEGRKVFPTLTVEENLNLGGYTRRRHRHALAEGRDRVYQLFPRLKERRHQLAGTLSGGEQQMLAIGRGLMASPRLLLLDEPSLGLAPKLVVEIFRTIKAINRQGVAVLLVEQNARLALHVAQRGYVLETGRLVLEGVAHQLQGDPQIREAYLGGRV